MITVQFTPELSAFQGLLISIDYVHPFKNLSIKGGNEKTIESIIHDIRIFLRSNNYLNDSGIIEDANNMMRQLALYIVLNSDLSVLNELVSTDSTIDLLIWTVPTIPKYLMAEMLWNLSMETFVYEIIAFSYPQLSIEVADALLLNLKYMNPTECLKQLQVLSSACFNVLCRINFFSFEECLLKSGLSNFLKCMAYFCNPPNEGKLERLPKDDLYKYYGNCLSTMLTIVWNCITSFNTIQTWDLKESVAIYEVTYNNNLSKKNAYEPFKCSNRSVVEILNKCFEDLLDKCMKLVMGINLDIFCSWSEFEEKGTTMQERVGKLCYKVRERLLNSELCDHPVVSMLEQISRKPVHILEIINTTDSSVITNNITLNNDESMEWVKALIHRDNLFEDKNLLQTLYTNFDQLNEDNCYNLFQKLYQHYNTCTENMELVQKLALEAFQHCNKEAKYGILDTHFKDKVFNNSLQSSQFTCMLTEIFNKFAVSPDSDSCDILRVFIQNPRHIFETIFKYAVENEQQTNLMVKVMVCLAKYSNYYYCEDTEPCLTVILKEIINSELSTDVKQDNLINFISHLKNSDIIAGSNLLLLIIMPKLHAALININCGDINLLCKIICTCYSVEDLLEYRTPMLAMLAQVMAQVRWKVNNFDELAPTILNNVIALQTSLMNSYKGTIPENEVSWLKVKLRNLEPLDMYYYRQLWNPPGNTFVEVVSGIHIHTNMDTESLTLWLAQVLTSSTAQEWTSIWQSLEEFGDTKVLDLFHDAMLSVLAAEKCNRTDKTWACMLYCYTNFVQCVRYNFFKEPLSDSQVTNVTDKLLRIASYIEEDSVEEFGMVVLVPLFAYIAQRREDYNIDVSQSLQVKLSHSKLGTMIQTLFSNGATV